jgi:hypothetical protein
MAAGLLFLLAARSPPADIRKALLPPQILHFSADG